MLKRISIISLFLAALAAGCKKESPNNTGVPNVLVSFTIDLYNVRYASLTTVGGWMYVSGGYNNNGIIVYRQTAATFLAFDQSCPYDCTTNSKAVVTVQSNNIFAVCPICGTQYSLGGGGTVSNKGPGTLALKQYYATYDQVEYVTVSSSP